METNQPLKLKTATPPEILIDLSGLDSPPSSPATRPPTRTDESLPKVASWTWTTPLQADKMTNVRHITSKPHNNAIISIIGKVQIRWSKLHCLRPFYSSDPPTSYYLNDDIMTATLHIFAATHNSDCPLSIWMRDLQAFTTLS